jgi:hypothetical protein
MLCTVWPTDSAGQPHVAEIALGTRLCGVLPLDGSVQAVLVGGYHGTWLETGQAARLPLAGSELGRAGASLGAGVLAAPPAGRCGLADTARAVR